MGAGTTPKDIVGVGVENGLDLSIYIYITLLVNGAGVLCLSKKYVPKDPFV